ncbi:MAG TPA: hypothetical protein VLL27_00360 [Solirubrobacterales bacterium]|nr:hypothetical protein [Solirubrobacterales bacterium]
MAAIVAVLLVILVAAPVAGAKTMVVQPDGKVVLGGSVFPRYAGLVRYEANGTLDSSFGVGGVAIERRLGPLDAIALQPDGRILFAASRFGSSTSPARAGASVPGALFGRLLADGTPDQEFGDSGLAVSPVEPILGAQPSAIVVRPDNSIVLATTHCCFKYFPPGFASVEQFSATGAFVGQLSTLTDHANGYRGYSLADLIPSTAGSLIGVGHGPVTSSTSGESGILTARFQSGTPQGYDPAFGKDGGLVIGPPAYATAAAEGQGKIVVAGFTDFLNGPANHGILLRYNADGTPDSGFGAEGRFDLVLASSVFSRLSEVAVEPDGSVIAVGFTYSGFNQASVGPCDGCEQAVVVKLTPNGVLDPAFGEGGIVRLGGTAGVPAMEAKDLAILGDGRILVSGATEAEYPSFVLARLTPNGALDPTFGQGGVAITTVCPGSRHQRIRERCFPKPKVSLRVQHLRSHKPTLRLRVDPNLPWAGITGLRLILPRALRLHPRRIEREGGLLTHVAKRPDAEPVVHPVGINFTRLGGAASATIRLANGAFGPIRALGRHGRLVFRVKVRFDVGPYPEQTVVVRRHL